MHAKRPEDSCIHFGAGTAVQLDLFCSASHSMEPGPMWVGRAPMCLALGLQLLVLPSSEFIGAPTLHVGIEHFQGPAAGVDLVVMSEVGEPFEDAEQVLVPGAAPDLQIAGAALRTERPEPRELVAALCRRGYGEATHCAHQVECLALPGLPRILAETDMDPLAVPCGGIEQQSFDVARVCPPAHHI